MSRAMNRPVTILTVNTARFRVNGTGAKMKGEHTMNKDTIIRKLTSRKFWMALAAFVSGLIVAFGGESTTAETVAGLIMQGAAVVGYLLAEGLTDAAALKAEANTEGETE